ncbi:PAP2 superfamily protein [Prauserella muralis]|nr:PAP2 superfamily protein [Prauserella muralis]
MLLVGLGFGVFQLLWVAVSGEAAVADANADALYRFEQELNLAVEPSFHALADGEGVLASVAGYYYVVTHFAVTAGLLVWLWWRHPRSYPRLRTTLIGVSLSALICFWVVPVAPPRLAMAASPDTLVQRDVFGSAHADGGLLSLANPYAAMPSLHVAWAVWAALVVSLARHRLRWLVWLYPLTTTAVVLATGNHYLLDAVAGFVLVLAVHAALGLGDARLLRDVPVAGTLIPASNRVAEEDPRCAHRPRRVPWRSPRHPASSTGWCPTCRGRAAGPPRSTAAGGSAEPPERSWARGSAASTSTDRGAGPPPAS